MPQLVGLGLPDEAALAWVDGSGRTRTSYCRELLETGDPQGEGDGDADSRRVPALAAAPEQLRQDRTDGSPSPAAPPTPTPTAAPTIEIIAFGDSITYGRGSSTGGPATGYPAILQTILEYNYPHHPFLIYNKGKSGERTTEGLVRFEAVIDKYPADCALIMEGTNDMFFQIAFETVQQNLKQMAFYAVAHGVLPILATLTPVLPGPRPEQYRLTRAFYTGGYVQSLAARYHLPYADQWNAFCGIPNWGTRIMDRVTGNHPNDNGYRFVMAPEWYDALAPSLGMPLVPVAPAIAITKSAPSVGRGSRENFNYTLTPSNDLILNWVDVYVALGKPTGALLFLSPKRQFVAQTAAFASGVLLEGAPTSGFLLDLPIAPNAPVGNYRLYVVTTRSLRSPWAAANRNSWSETSFEVR
ncbi:MAG: SGNH/GDSL hydrolase family protein [Candidatus Aureabacteria bacterium]|nr:SGNH/GDSL hydrolase family protein [Candidatus Auribacterota bacterium]